ncbi:hypothetical protein HDU76_012260, partial [Blyttiomyces sp. JEL0837]
YIVTGGEDGFVKIFDLQFRLILWFEKLRAGPIKSICFSASAAAENDSSQSILSGLNFPEFVVSTSHSRVLLLNNDIRLKTSDDKNSNKGTVSRENKAGETVHSTHGSPEVKTLIEGQYADVYDLAIHPSMHRFAVGGHSGILQVWDYSTKSMIIDRHFEIQQVVHDNGNKKHHGGSGKKEELQNVSLKIQCLAYSCDGSLI